MKKLVAILLAIAMLLSLAACGGETAEDPNAGKYLGTTAKAFGMIMDMSEIYPGETWLELKSGGKGNIMLDGDEFPIKWALEGDTFTLTIDGVDSVGTLNEGVIVMDLMDMGVEMTFLKEGMEAPVSAATYNDAGYWEIVRVDSDDPESVVTEEDMLTVKALGVMMYLELKADGTGVLYIEEEMPVTWQDGSITITEDALTVPYTVENGEMVLDMLEAVFVLRKGAGTVSEMEQAGFTSFMNVGEPYAYDTVTSDDSTISTVGEVTVTSYEIFESAEHFPAKEGYEWRVVKMEVRFYDENTGKYGCRVSSQTEDYYNPKLHDDTLELLEETDGYKLYAHTILHNGQQMEAYEYYISYWGDWYTGKDGNDEIIRYLEWDFLVPVGYDGCVASLSNPADEWAEGTYITDYDPADFLLFRAD